MTPGDDDKDAQLALALDALAIAKGALKSNEKLLEAKDAQLVDIKQAFAIALEDNRELRQMNYSLTAAQAAQFNVLAELYLAQQHSTKFVELEMTKWGSRKWGHPGHFYTEHGKNEKTQWFLWLHIDCDPPTLRLWSCSKKNFCASAVCEVLGKRIEMETHPFSGYSYKKDMPMPMTLAELNRLMQGLTSIKVRVAVTVHGAKE